MALRRWSAPAGAMSWRRLRVARWVAAFPGAAIVLAVLGLNLLGDALNDLLDPRRRPAAPGRRFYRAERARPVYGVVQVKLAATLSVSQGVLRLHPEGVVRLRQARVALGACTGRERTTVQLTEEGDITTSPSVSVKPKIAVVRLLGLAGVAVNAGAGGSPGIRRTHDPVLGFESVAAAQQLFGFAKPPPPDVPTSGAKYCPGDSCVNTRPPFAPIPGCSGSPPRGRRTPESGRTGNSRRPSTRHSRKAWRPQPGSRTEPLEVSTDANLGGHILIIIGRLMERWRGLHPSTPCSSRS